MFQLITIESFQEVYPILKEAFPSTERRIEERQKGLLAVPEYELYGVKEENKIQGLVALWEFEEFIFIEHFAIAPEFRNGGFGGRVLESIIKWKNKAVILEVEEPLEELQKRRIGFYERHNFFYNAYSYLQPPLRENQEFLPLKVMTRPNAINLEEFEQYKSLIYKFVYQYKER